MTQNEYDKWYRELNETQKEVTDEFLAWKEKASKGKDGYADIVITMINGKAEVAIREGEYISPFRGFQMSLKQNGRILSSCNWRCEDGVEKFPLMDDDRREYEAELKECEKEWKAERASSDYKNELKEYEKARRRGDEVAARTLKRLMDAVDDNYRAEVEEKQNSYNRFQREPLELCEEWKSIVKCYEAIVNRLRNYQAVKEYVFRVTEVPSEKLVLGHEIERRSEEKSEGREYILLYLKKILKVDESRLQEAANNDVILAEFGKSWINSGVEKLLIKERLNEGSIERLQHAIESHKILLSTVSDPDILRRAEDAMDESEKTLDECMKTRGDLDKEFNCKDLELKAAFNRLTEPDTRKLASENNTNSANIVKATTTKQSNNSQTVTIAQPAAVKPSEKQEKGVTCGNCGKENKDGAKFCRYCGTPLIANSIRFCTECGHKIRPGGKFCPACGTKVED